LYIYFFHSGAFWKLDICVYLYNNLEKVRKRKKEREREREREREEKEEKDVIKNNLFY